MTLDEMYKNYPKGSKFETKLHPSGERFDGPATVVGHWWNSFFYGLKVVSDSDPSGRIVSETIGAFKGAPKSLRGRY
jgi:hypothetical protein